jgi:hypothetical protein
VVIARLDRAIQYSRGGSDDIEKARRTGYPHARGMTSFQPRAPWLTRGHRDGENAVIAAAGPLKFEAYLRSDRIQNAPDIEMSFLAPEIDDFPWLASTLLAFEACEVIRLRLTKFASAADDAEREACLMVSEKIDAMFEAGASMLAGASPEAIIGRYREHVAANARRLSVA